MNYFWVILYKLAGQFEENQWVQSFSTVLKKIAGYFVKQMYTDHKGEKMAFILNQKFLKLDYYYPFFRKMYLDKELNHLIPNFNFNSSYYAFDLHISKILIKNLHGPTIQNCLYLKWNAIYNMYY